jgi:selenocysteine-specific elongation factor
MAIDLILGTAGHIDHGKTSLVRALTGTDTDRLPEEKRRGITIELGFAELDLAEFRLGIVDVPGHEKFVRQMLAGATGMDLAMLVVAADDSVKPQTREHMDVLRLLDLPAGVIALTKCDLADQDWIDLVESEVRELVEGTFLADAPILRTSSETMLGIDELKQALIAAATQAHDRRLQATAAAEEQQVTPFRMAIDRSFTIAGHGTVVTGSVASGRAAVGDEVLVQPDGLAARIRGLNNHGRPVEMIERGQRAAMNLAGIHHEEIERGHELASPGHLRASDLLTVSLQVLPATPRPLKHRSTVRLHVGTAEVLATIALLEQDKLTAGEQGFAQLFLRESVAAVWNQPFVIRSESPVVTIGGGRILVPNAAKLKKPTKLDLTHLHNLATSDDEASRVGSAIYFAGFAPWAPHDLARLAGAKSPSATIAALESSEALIALEVSPRRTALVQSDYFDAWSERISRQLAKLHDEHPMRSAIDTAKLISDFAYVDDAALLTAVIKQMARAGHVRLTDRGVAHRDHKLKLSKPQQALLAEIIARYEAAKCQPPSIAEYQKEIPNRADDIQKLIQIAVAEEQLVHVTKDLYLHTSAMSELKSLLSTAFAASDGLTVSDIRELLNTTRKFAVPICEYLDRQGFTRRKGDVRVLASS